jgi:glycosyltransferase involved in cell wall biosynthesis
MMKTARVIPKRKRGVLCQACPLPPGSRCPSSRNPRLCGLAAEERDRLSRNPDHDPYWLREIYTKGGPPPEPASRVLIRSTLYAHGGYGQVAEWFGRGLDALGVQVAYEPIGISEEFLPLPAFVRERVVNGAKDAWEFLIDVPSHQIRADRRGTWCSMWECSSLAAGAADRINEAELVIVPSEWCVRVFRDSGVDRPIHIVPLGVSADEGYRSEGPYEGSQTIFGTVLKMAHGPNRKGLWKGVKAFLRAFPNEPDVELRIKCLPDCLPLLGGLPRDPRIKVYSKPLFAPEMADWIRACTAGFLPTSGEGFGLPGLQFMAVGRPVVMPEATGQATYFDERFGFAVPWRWAAAGDYFIGTGGEWCEPTEDGLVAGLRWVYEHPDEARAKGEAGAERALEFSWENSGRLLLAALRASGMLAESTEPNTGEPSANGSEGRVEPSLPSWMKRVGNAAQAAAQVAAGAIAGQPILVDEETKRGRLAICEACLPPKGYFRVSDRKCSHPDCGCPMDLKAGLAAMACPIGKWGAVQAETSGSALASVPPSVTAPPCGTCGGTQV